jgi:putative DNA primase/helicase
MADLKALKESVDIVSVIGRFVTLKKKGNDYEGCCPFHDEKTPSFKVNQAKQFFKCFGCGKSGDVWDYLYAYGFTTPEAVNYLQGGTGADFSKRPEKLEKPRAKWTTLVPTIEPPIPQHPSLGMPDRMFKYYTADGKFWGYVFRFNTGKNKKEFRQYTYCRSETGITDWRWQSWNAPRPLYNLHLLAQNPDKPIILVEGEKCADFITENTDYIATTWMHGVESLKYMDFEPLKGREVYGWPDNDEVGYKAMQIVADSIGGFAGIINNPPGAPKGWDCADLVPMNGMTIAESAGHYIKENLMLTSDMDGIKEPPAPKPNLPDLPSKPIIIGSDYFRILGYEKTDQGQLFHFFSYPSQTMISLSATALSKTANLIQLAPLHWWETNYPKPRGGLDINMAINALICASYEVGFFSDKWIRGRGAWIDGGKVVIHAGDQLIIEGQSKHFKDHSSKFLYERNEDLEFNIENALTKTESSRLLDMLRMISWDREVNAHLLAGWCVVAPICGALAWRPHIWLTGPAGCGKSWIYSFIVRRCLGEVALSVQGETTEAGLRQTLRHDARPVVFDEFEGVERKDQDRLQNILGLIRQSSSHDGGVIVKGTAGGGSSKTYKIRSCFALASIAVQLEQQSDRTRVTVLSVKKLEDPVLKDKRWKELQSTYANLFTEEFCKRLRARTVRLMPVILKNAEVFSNAAAHELGEQRSGDQIGALLAGAYSLVSDHVITFDKAVEWIRQHDWTEERSLTNTRDELQLIRHLMDQKVKADFAGIIKEMTVGELVMLASGREPSDYLTSDEANKSLRKNGIKVDLVEINRKNEMCLIIANQHDQLKRWLANEPRWQKNHNKLLRRVNGSVAMAPTVFAGPVKPRAVAIPLWVFDREE